MGTKIFHISDLHIGRLVPTEANEESRNLEIIVNWLVKHYGEDKITRVVLITGDLADDGTRSQFEDVRRLLQPLYDYGFIVWPVPGNHDYGTDGIHAKASRFIPFKDTFFSKNTPPFYDENVSYPHVKLFGGHLFLGLNSMKAETGFVDGLLADGELGSKQIKNIIGVLRKYLDRPPTQKVIVHLHHHPFMFPDQSLIEKIADYLTHRLKDGPELMHNIAGKIDILLFGHEHHHLDFSGTAISRQYRIPIILSNGKSTEQAKAFAMKDDGTVLKGTVLAKGLLGRMIEIDDEGVPSVMNIEFDK
ncbi:MAG: metallophosphoesterase [Thermodesulfobacteriota bacterium]